VTQTRPVLSLAIVADSAAPESIVTPVRMGNPASGVYAVPEKL
jgi:hypothetical protein